MKILIDARLYGLEHAGLGRYILNLVNELEIADRENNYIILLRKSYFDKLNFPKNWKKVLADFKHYSFREQLDLPGLISREKPDLVHFPHFNIPLFYPGKFVVTIHDLLMQEHRGAKATTLPAYLYYLKHFGSKLVFEQAVKRAEKIIVPSYAVAGEVETYFKTNESKIAVTYEGVEEKFFSDKTDKYVLGKYSLHDKYFLYTGNAYPHKNLEMAIRAIIKLNKSSKNKILFAVSCSRGIFTSKLESLIKKLNCEDIVRLLGFVPDEDLVSLLGLSSGFIYPSLSEGFGLPALEAFASGTLCLVSDIPVFREVYKDNCFYFDPYDADSLVDKLKEVINLEQDERHEIISKNKKFAREYSWKKMTLQTLEIYKSIAQNY